MSTIVERIKELSSQLRLSENKFAGEIGVNVQTLNNYTNGKRNVSYDVVDKILARFPQVSAEWLIRGIGNMMCGKDPFSPNPENGLTTDLQRTHNGGTTEDVAFYKEQAEFYKEQAEFYKQQAEYYKNKK